MTIKKPSAVESPYITTDTTPNRLASSPVAGGGVTTVAATVSATVSATADANANTTTSSSTGSNVSYYTSGIEGIAGLASSGRVFDGANVYVTLEQPQYVTYNQTFTIGNSISVTGNITTSDGYFIGDGSQLTGISSSGNFIVNGNSKVDVVSPNGNIVVDSNGNTWTFTSQNTLVAPGGSQWTNEANADAYFTSSLDGYVHLQSLFADSNIGSEMFLQHGLATITAHAVGSNTDYVWTFDNGGNLTLPGNTFQINYANGSPASLGSTYGNANVVANLAALGSNPVSTTGNVTANYFIGLLGNITNLNSLNFTAENISALVGNNGVNIGAGGYNNLVVLPTEVLIQNVPLTVAGNILSTVAGGLNITANTVANGTAQIWNFGTDGRLTFPGTPRIATDSDNFEVQAAESINFEANAVVSIYTDTSGNAYQWQFGDDGNLTAPGNISATGNITGNNINATATMQLAVYANATVRDSSISSPTPGMMIYVTGTGMQVRGATSWNTIAGSGT